jgi:hypothetical protein
MSDEDRAAALDGALAGMFKAIEARGTPDHLRMIVDLLEASAPPAQDEAAATPSPSPRSSPEP